MTNEELQTALAALTAKVDEIYFLFNVEHRRAEYDMLQTLDVLPVNDELVAEPPTEEEIAAGITVPLEKCVNYVRPVPVDPAEEEGEGGE
jgi:hypothetical protein